MYIYLYIPIYIYIHIIPLGTSQKKATLTFTGAVEIEEALGKLDTLEWLDERLVKVAVPENLEKVCLAPQMQRPMGPVVEIFGG